MRWKMAFNRDIHLIAIMKFKDEADLTYAAEVMRDLDPRFGSERDIGS
jgi:hypothetical protein